jgi:predicted small secreted protein
MSGKQGVWIETMKRAKTSSLLCLVVLVIAATLTSCGSRVRGTYSGKDTGFLDKMTFESDGKVELTFMGMTKEGTYVVEDKKVKITNAGETHVLTIDDQGCLDGGGLLGKYCKESSSSSASESALSGVYRAGSSQGGISLDFRGGQKVLVTVSEGRSENETKEGTYKTSGDKITVTVPGGEPLILHRKGDALEGSLDGLSVNFVRP